MKIRARKSKPRPVELPLESNQWELLKLHLERYKPDTMIEIEVRRFERKESSPMRKYYFGYVLKRLLEATGYDPDEALIVHHNLKGTFFEHDPEYDVKRDERGIFRNVPHVFSKKSPVPISKKKEFIAWVTRKGVEYGAEYDR